MFNFDDHEDNFGTEDDEIQVVFGATNEIVKYAQISRHFLINIVDIEPEMCFISDISSLSDFLMDEDVMAREIFLHYGIEIDDIEDGNLVAIFKRIKEEGLEPWKR